MKPKFLLYLPAALTILLHGIGAQQPNSPTATLLIDGRAPSAVDPTGHRLALESPGQVTVTVVSGVNVQAGIIVLTGTPSFGAALTAAGSLDLAALSIVADGVSLSTGSAFEAALHTGTTLPATLEMPLFIPAGLGGIVTPGFQFAVHDPSNPGLPFRLTEAVSFELARITVDIDVDTDRDGTIEDLDDDATEHEWVSGRGAIYLVNDDCDDGSGKPDNFLVDRMTLPLDRDGPGPLPAGDFDVDGVADSNDASINVFDEPDITHFVVRDPADCTVMQMVLRVPSSLAERIRIFNDVAAGAREIFGPDHSDAGAFTDIDITALVLCQGDREFGLEGIEFRTVSPAFDGCVPLTLRVVLAGGGVMEDVVRLKVAPLILQPNTHGTQRAFIVEATPANMDAPGDNVCLVTRLQATGMLTTVPWATFKDQWCQDEVEIGYSKAPPRGMAPLEMNHVFDLPRERGLDGTVGILPKPGGGVVAAPMPPGDTLWPELRLMGQECDLGWFGIPFTDPDSGEYGGNLEVVPETPAFPLGRIVYGNTMASGGLATDSIVETLERQEIQFPFAIRTDWLAVGHVDEVLNFLPDAGAPRGFRAVLASPRRAIALVGGLPAALNGRAVFWGDNGPAPVCAFVGQESNGIATGGNQTQLLHAGRDFTTTAWTFIRIYSGTGAGQVGLVSARANGSITVSRVWRTGQDLLRADGTGLKHKLDETSDVANLVETQTSWFVNPANGSRYVVVTASKRWFNFLSAITSNLQANAAAGANTVTVRNGAIFVLNDDVLIRDDLGNMETREVVGIAGNVLTLDANLVSNYATANAARVSVPIQSPFSLLVPSLWSVQELKANLAGDLGTFNELADDKIRDPGGIVADDIRETLLDENAVGVNDLRELPVLYWGDFDAAGTDIAMRSADAMTPGMVNFQVVGNTVFLPRQFFIRPGAGDLFENESQATLPGVMQEFVDCWDLYHRLKGEVHCGTQVRRLVPATRWWTLGVAGSTCP